ncbi:MAG: tetratricopeptide repeat protein [Syntrophaceae bacterium]|nr:tetratricopeptide repeat protein [Syntrophaceae bacterium]
MTSKNYSCIIIIFLIVCSCAAFGRIAGNDFIVSSDDSALVTENNYVKSGLNAESIKYAFTTKFFGYMLPLTIFSHMLDWSIFGANPSGHHLVNLLIHIGAVIFLFLFLNKTTNSIWPSAFAAAFFALHPLRVESVASSGVRKDVLSMFFGILSIYTYTFYAEKTKISWYFLCLILFVLSLMSKPMLVTLPFLLILLDYWPLGRWQKVINEPAGNRFKIAGKLIGEKVPFIILTIVVSIVTLWITDKTGTVVPLDYLPFLKRVANAIVSYVAYLGKTLWPVNLAIIYPYDFSISIPLWKILFSSIILLITTFAVIFYIKKLPFLFVCWFWYLGTLIPVLGLIQRSPVAMADRFTYLPSIGIAIMLSWGISSLIKNKEIRKKILFTSVFIVLAILIVLTWKQCGYWKNDNVLWNHVLKVTKDNYIAHNNLAVSLTATGQYEKAIEHHNKAISIAPFELNYYSRGLYYIRTKQYQRAVEDFSKAINLKPDNIMFYNYRGIAYAELRQYQQAVEDFSTAIRMKEDHAESYNNRGNVYARLGQYQQSIDDYNEAICLNSKYTKAYINRAIVYMEHGEKNLGCLDAQKACALGKCEFLYWTKSKGYCQ